MCFCPVGWGNLKEGDNLEDAGIGAKMIIIKRMLKRMGGCRMDRCDRCRAVTEQ
jgi:hypothetical protein